MEQFRRTVYGAALQTAQMLGIPLTIPANSTLNEKLSIQANATLGMNERPIVKYMTIGISGHRARVGADNIPLIESIQHEPTDAASYKMLPFVVRLPENDIPSQYVSRYALRRLETINSVQYVVYYMRRLDYTNVNLQLQKKTINNNITTTVPFVPSTDNLNPTPPVLSNTGVNTITAQYVNVTAPVTIVIDTFDATEILNAAQIIYGSEDYAFISEIGLCSGVDRTVTVTDPGNVSKTYNEVVAAQVCTHINALQPLTSQRDGFTAVLDIGAVEPMFIFTTP